MAQKASVLKGQNIYDISVQATGTVENAMAILAANGLGISDPLSVGLVLPEQMILNNKTLTFYTNKKIIPGTIQLEEAHGIGIDQIGIDFKIGS